MASLNSALLNPAAFSRSAANTFGVRCSSSVRDRSTVLEVRPQQLHELPFALLLPLSLVGVDRRKEAVVPHRVDQHVRRTVVLLAALDMVDLDARPGLRVFNVDVQEATEGVAPTDRAGRAGAGLHSGLRRVSCDDNRDLQLLTKTSKQADKLSRRR